MLYVPRAPLRLRIESFMSCKMSAVAATMAVVYLARSYAICICALMGSYHLSACLGMRAYTVDLALTCRQNIHKDVYCNIDTVVLSTTWTGLRMHHIWYCYFAVQSTPFCILNKVQHKWRMVQNPAALTQLVELEKADVLCLQETKLQDKGVEEIEARTGLKGWHHAWNCSTARKGYSGTAIISRYSLLMMCLTSCCFRGHMPHLACCITIP